jgi:hypothetical protein
MTRKNRPRRSQPSASGSSSYSAIFVAANCIDALLSAVRVAEALGHYRGQLRALVKAMSQANGLFTNATMSCGVAHY